MTTTRRDVLRGLSGLAIISTLPGCGGGDDPGTDAGHTHDAGMDSAVMDSAVADAAPVDAGICSTVTTTVAMAASHNHNLTVQVSASDVVAAAEKTYTISGGHTHTFTLTSGNFATLASGASVMTVSTSADVPSTHAHNITVVCAGT